MSERKPPQERDEAKLEDGKPEDQQVPDQQVPDQEVADQQVADAETQALEAERRQSYNRRYLQVSSPMARRAIYHALSLAQVRDERCTSVHLLSCLLNVRSVRSVIAHLGVRWRRIRAATVAHLLEGLEGPYSHEDRTPMFNAAIERFVTQAISLDYGRATGVHLLIALWAGGESPATRILEDNGVSLIQLRCYVADPPSALARWREWWRRAGPRGRVTDGVDERELLPEESILSGPRMERGGIPSTQQHVYIHDDPFTTKAFVVEILREQFGKSESEATRIMQQAHHTGLSLVGVLTDRAARRILDRIHEQARASGYPLRLTLHPQRLKRRFWHRWWRRRNPPILRE